MLTSDSIPNQSNSRSLWNYTLYPGWTSEEVEVLKIALIKYGFGRWRRIIDAKCLPGKTIVQMNHQTQRLIGQQSLSEFMGLHVDLEKIFLDNLKKDNVYRKNNFIINAGNNRTGSSVSQLLKDNKEKYGYPPEYFKSLKLPRTLSNLIGPYMTIKQITDPKNNLTIPEKIEELKNLINSMKKKLEIIDSIELGRKRDRDKTREEGKERDQEKIKQKEKAKRAEEILLQEELSLSSNNRAVACSVALHPKGEGKSRYPDREIFDEVRKRFYSKRNQAKQKKRKAKFNKDISNFIITLQKKGTDYEII